MHVSNQHYVPEFYLKYFAVPGTNGLKIHTYNITFKKIEELKSINRVCSEKHFYDSDIDRFIEDFESQGLEKSLSRIEGQFAQFAKKLLDEKSERYIITNEERIDLAYYLYIQYVRTKGFRDKLKKMQELSESTQHAATMLLENIIKTFTDALTYRSIEILIAKNSEREFLTCDNPVVLRSNFELTPDGINGFLEHMSSTGEWLEGVFGGHDVIFPLSPQRCLILLDQPGEPNLISRPASNEEVDKLNVLIMQSAYKYIFSSRLIPELKLAEMLYPVFSEFVKSTQKNREEMHDMIRDKKAQKQINIFEKLSHGVNIDNLFNI